MRTKTSLSQRGYGIPISRLSESDLHEIKKDLTVKPLNFGQDMIPSNSFEIFSMSTNKIYVPKCYGLNKFGIPEEETFSEGSDIKVRFEGELRENQVEPVSEFLKACQDPLKRGGILNISCAGGKCLGKDTNVLMFDGNVKPVQDIKVGEKIMGDDGKQRNILSICCGKDELYKIIPNDSCFEPYVVNSAHILSLKSVNTNRKYDIHILNYICIEQYFISKGAPNPFVGYTYSPFFKEREGGEEEEVLGTLGNSKDIDHLDDSSKIRCLRMHGFKVKSENEIKNYNLSLDSHSHSHSYSFTIQKLENVGDYYGFEIDGNRRFLLADCTVTHNTVIGLNVLSKLSKKTLIIVHKNFLLEQWKERIRQFIPEARIGTLKAQIIDVQDKDIVIASLQSLSMKSYDPEVFKGIGFVIVDEIHRTGTEVFSRALQKVNCKYSMGLTATLERKDGLSKVFTWAIGDVVYKNKKVNDRVHVEFSQYFHESPSYSKEERMANQKFNTSRMISNITDFSPRTKFIVGKVKEKMIESDFKRRFLILSDRKKHLSSIETFLKQHLPDESVGYYIGGMKEEELKKSEKKNIILATFSFASEGFDVQGLDTLILASPKTNMEQIVGRILREKEEVRKNTPLIIDIFDDFSFFKNQAKKRKTYYRKMKYELL